MINCPYNHWQAVWSVLTPSPIPREISYIIPRHFSLVLCIDKIKLLRRKHFTQQEGVTMSKENQTPQRCIRVSDDLWQRLKDRAQERGLTATDAIIQGIIKYVESK